MDVRVMNKRFGFFSVALNRNGKKECVPYSRSNRIKALSTCERHRHTNGQRVHFQVEIGSNQQNEIKSKSDSFHSSENIRIVCDWLCANENNFIICRIKTTLLFNYIFKTFDILILDVVYVCVCVSLCMCSSVVSRFVMCLVWRTSMDYIYVCF